MKKILFLMAIMPMFLVGCSKDEATIENEVTREDETPVFSEPNTISTKGTFEGYLTEMQNEYDVMGLSLYSRDYFGVALSSLRDSNSEFIKKSTDKKGFNEKIKYVSSRLNDGINVSTIDGISYPSSKFTKEQKNRLSYYNNALVNLKSQVESYMIK